jgi:NAD(P)H-dependent flavin oxidoreductase YrpB (nitropropane dioxygenase family)
MNALCDKLGIKIPILLAPMGGAVGPELTAAVSNAGGLGLIPLWWMEPDIVRSQIRATRSLTKEPFGVNLNLNWPQEDRLAICLEEGVRIISFFWGHSPALVERARAAQATVLQTVSSAEEARQAIAEGADIVVAQGWEAGGHVRGTVATLPLVPAVVDAVAPKPVVAAGGIADGRGLAAVMALGASAAWIGTRFLLSDECPIHPHYRERLIAASEADTLYTSAYDVGWPDAPHRLLRNGTLTTWENAGSPPPGKRPGEGDIIARSPSAGDIVRYQIYTPGADAEGEIDETSMWAGQGVALLKRTEPAGDIVREIWRDADNVLKRLAGSQTAPAG